jgi:hypothetical protein
VTLTLTDGDIYTAVRDFTVDVPVTGRIYWANANGNTIGEASVGHWRA